MGRGERFAIAGLLWVFAALPVVVRAQDCCQCSDCGGALVFGTATVNECFGNLSPGTCGDDCDEDGCDSSEIVPNATCNNGTGLCEVFTPTSTPTQTPTQTPTHTPTSTPTATSTPTRTLAASESSCTDRIDNNGNGLTDCADPACAHVPPCGAPAPALSPVLLVIMAMLLSFLGALSLSRRRRRG